MVLEQSVQIGNPIITTISNPVEDINDPLVKKIITDLTDSMRHQELVGMAAPQIGYNLRIFVTEIRKTPARPERKTDVLRIFINPTITWKSEEEIEIYEGCGSVAYSNLFAPISRPQAVEITALDENGKTFLLKTDGLLGRCIQHEQDHLDGKVFAFHIKDITRIMSKDEYMKQIVFGK